MELIFHRSETTREACLPLNAKWMDGKTKVTPRISKDAQSSFGTEFLLSVDASTSRQQPTVILNWHCPRHITNVKAILPKGTTSVRPLRNELTVKIYKTHKQTGYHNSQQNQMNESYKNISCQNDHTQNTKKLRLL